MTQKRKSRRRPRFSHKEYEPFMDDLYQVLASHRDSLIKQWEPRSMGELGCIEKMAHCLFYHGLTLRYEDQLYAQACEEADKLNPPPRRRAPLAAALIQTLFLEKFEGNRKFRELTVRTFLLWQERMEEVRRTGTGEPLWR